MRLILVIALLVSTNAFSQWKSYIIGVKGDTLNRVDMKDRKQGRWVIKVDDARGERGYEEQGVFKDGKRDGTWRRFSLEGDLLAIENYRWGNKNGKNVYFDNFGNLVREESWKAVNPDNPYDTVDVTDPLDPTKVIGHQVVKLEGFSLKHGLWKFYNPMNGKLEETQAWYLDKPARKEGDELAPIDVTDNNPDNVASGDNPGNPSDTATRKKYPKPQAILDFEKKNAGKKKVRVRTGETGN